MNIRLICMFCDSGIKESGYGKESGKDVAVEEYLVTKTGTLTLADHY